MTMTPCIFTDRLYFYGPAWVELLELRTGAYCLGLVLANRARPLGWVLDPRVRLGGVILTLEVLIQLNQ